MSRLSSGRIRKLKSDYVIVALQIVGVVLCVGLLSFIVVSDPFGAYHLLLR